jgi:ABC-2 type transport system permease protein
MNEQTTVSRSEFKLVSSSWLRGFEPIFRKELAAWFGTSRWITQLIMWMALGVIPPITVMQDSTNERGISVLTLFLWAGSNMMSIGTILLAQGTIVEEKLTQTLLWIFSKPLSPAGFILGKFAAYAVFIGTIVLGAPAIVTFIAAKIIGLPPQISIFNYIAGVLMLYLVLLFALALTILLGVIFDRVGAVAALTLLIFFYGSSLQSNPQLSWIEPYSVWALQHNSYETMTGKFPATAWIAIASGLLMTGLLLSISIWRTKRSEL